MPQAITRRKIAGEVAPDFVADPEARRVLQSLSWRIQWILDNWPEDEQSVADGTGFSQEEIQAMIDKAILDLLARLPQGGGDSGGGASYSFDQSVVNDGGVVTLENDEDSPGNDKVYGTDSGGTRGWIDAPSFDFSFKFTKTSDTGGTFTLGRVYIGGVSKTISSWPVDGIVGSLTTSYKYWIAIEMASSTASFVGGTSFPASDSDTEIWPILEVTCADDVISSFVQRQCSDIHLTLTP
jgi:hypothetical protein